MCVCETYAMYEHFLQHFDLLADSLTHTHACRGRQEYIGYVHVCGYIRPHMCAAGLVEVSTLAGRARDVHGQQEGREEQGKREKRKEEEGVEEMCAIHAGIIEYYSHNFIIIPSLLFWLRYPFIFCQTCLFLFGFF